MPIKKLHVDLENCYGIRALQTDFDFEHCDAYAIYAPNGAMKTSFAQTFRDLSQGRASKDLIFPARKSRREIVDDTGEALAKESVLVVSPYDPDFDFSDKTATLLVNAKLKREYATLQADVDQSKKALLKVLKSRSGSKKNIEEEVSRTFTTEPDQFCRALVRVKDEVALQDDAPLANTPYDTIFNEKVLAFLETRDFKTAIAAYVETYNRLLDSSTYFSRQTFNYYNAAQIARSLATNGFFEAQHSVTLKADTSIEIKSRAQLEAVIEHEKSRIIDDDELKKRYEDIEKPLTKNADLRAFQNHLSEHPELLPRLQRVDGLKEDIWKSYFKASADLYDDVIHKYQSALRRMQEIEEDARRERTQWERVIEIFNERFIVPFNLNLVNRERVMLGTDPMPRLAFTFREDEGGDEANVDKPTLMKALSLGERKALYVLNVIFEVEARKQAKAETLFVVDDIADSFDYRNKYAIIQYLMDISQAENFKEIILTHNFDFFRTVNSRFVGYEQCLMAAKTSQGLSVTQAQGIKNPFIRDWKKHFFMDASKRIASIPFLRNLIEYTKGESDPNFRRLTSLLHWKSDSESIAQRELDGIYSGLFGGEGQYTNEEQSVMEMVVATADACVEDDATANGRGFHDKIVLSIAIRVAAERFMAETIDDEEFLADLGGNQTYKLLQRFERDYGDETEALDVIKSVLLMTPENIHLNSFMYEPIVDMSDDHLKRLYRRVKELRVIS